MTVHPDSTRPAGGGPVSPGSRLVWYVGTAAGLGLLSLVFPFVNWRGDTYLHRMLETAASILAIMIGVMALTRFYSRKDSMFQLIGTAFIGTGLLDLYHAVLTSPGIASHLPSMLAAVTPWSWLSSPLFLAVMLSVSCLARSRDGWLGGWVAAHDRSVYLFAATLLVVSSAVFLVLPLPRAVFPEWWVARPQELAAAALFGIALYGQIRKGAWRQEVYEHWLVLGIIVELMTHAAIMSRSSSLHDVFFNAAHIAKPLGYLCVLTGLVINMFNVFKRLDVSLAETRMIGARLDAAHQDLERRIKERTAELDASRQFVTSVVEQLPNMVFVKDAATLRFVQFNCAAEEVTGWSKQELLGKSDYDVFPKEQADFFTSTDRAALAGGALVEVSEERMQTKANGLRTLRTKKIPIHDSQGRPQFLLGISEDITERHRTEQIVAKLRDLQQAILANAPHGIMTTDADGILTSFNPAAEQMLGYRAEEAVGNLHLDAFHDRAELAARAAELSQSLDVEKPTTFDVLVEESRRDLPNQHEWTFVRKDDSRFPVLTNVTALPGPGGTVAGFLCLAIDLSERRAANERFRSIVEESPAGLVVVNPAGQIVLANRQIERQFRYDRSALIGQPIEMLLPERFRHNHPSRVQAFFARPEARTMGAGRNLAGRRQDGSEFPVEIGLSPIQLPQGLHVLASVVDITARQKSESARFQLQQAINYGMDGMALLDSEGCYTYMNPAHAAMFGYEVDELLGKSWKQLFHPEWVSYLEQMCLPDIAANGQWQGELVGKTRSGEPFHIELSMATIGEDRAGTHTLVCTCRDITKRKRMERDLIAAKDAAESAARAKAEFLATMSHEIRTPMNGVIGMTGLLLDTTLTREQRDYAETVRRSGEALLAIINDILDFSKIEAGKLSLEIIDFDLRTTVEETLDLLAEPAHRKHLELVGLIDAAVPTALRGDPGRLRQILTNLIGNAVKFTERGEVVLKLSADKPDERTATLRFEIVDTGIGISPENQARLFRSFSQADTSTTRRFGGTGLGLAISKQLVELMGGEIGVDSRPGEGSRFWFTVRLDRQASVPTQVRPAEDLTGLRVCLIDDNATNRMLLEHHARVWGMTHASAEDGPTGLALIREADRTGYPFDLAIVDMQMPGMDGMELARALRADRSIASPRLVLLTSLARRGDAKVARDSGFSAYLTKPIHQHQLYDSLRLVMGRSVPGSAEDDRFVTVHSLAEIESRSHGRVLLAEDNAINQKVAVKMIEKLGYHVDVVANGEEAIEALSRIPYMLVFMDCQMPEVDGFEATRRIRQREGTARRTPIVALTANAMQGDREHCLAAGMDDYVSKPIAAKDIQAALERWLNPSSSTAPV